MEKSSKFLIEVSVMGLAHFGFDTPISLWSSTRQASFREVTDQCLKRILVNYDPLVLTVVKMVLGSGHIECKEYGRDNLHVSSHFLASLLDNLELKVEAKRLLVKIFRKDLYENFDDVIRVVVEGRGCSRPCDVERVCSKDTVKIYPFLLDL